MCVVSCMLYAVAVSIRVILKGKANARGNRVIGDGSVHSSSICESSDNSARGRISVCGGDMVVVVAVIVMLGAVRTVISGRHNRLRLLLWS